MIQLQVDRAPVGRPVTVLGRRFFRSDRIVIGDVAAETRFKSANELEFLVPPLPAGESYFVQLETDGRMVPIGNFMVDLSLLKVAPKSLELAVGESMVLVFSVDFEAPAGGLAVRVTTDIPSSIIMPEVIIPAGSRSVSVAVEGARPGQGALFADVPGMKEVTIPAYGRGVSRRLPSDPEFRQGFLRRSLRPFGVADEIREALFDCGEKRPGLFPVSLRQKVNPPVGQILDKPGNLIPPGDLQGLVAESDALNLPGEPSLDLDSLVIHVSHWNEIGIVNEPGRA